MAFFISRDPVTHTITDPATGETATVDIVPLNAGDQVAIQDSIRMQIGEDASPEARIGSLKLLIVERALVGWSLDVAPTRNTIERLNPEVFEQIFQLANASASPNPTKTEPQS